MTLGRLAGLLQAKGKPYHIRGESSTTFEDVRDGPVVLIGAFNNDWSMRLMGPRRFSFERSGNTFWIKDHQNPSDQSHAVNYATPPPTYCLLPPRQRASQVVAGRTRPTETSAAASHRKEL